MFEHVNELAVVVASVLSVAVGSIWYSPLMFGTAWIKSLGLTPADEELTPKEAILVTVKGVITQTVFFFIIAQFITFSKFESIPLTMLGSYVTVLLISYMVSVVVWERRTLSYLFINAGYGVLALWGGMSIIAFWPW
jgi:hypothetical protein